MKVKSFVVAVGAALMLALATAPTSASTITYGWTATGHSGSFSFDDAAVSIGGGPFGLGGVAYNALDFFIDGIAQTNPLLVMYTDFGGNQYAFFTAASGYPYVQLGVTGTGLFASAAASEMDGRQLSDFSLISSLFAFGSGFSITSLDQSSAIPEPGTLALLGLGLAGLGLSRRRKAH